MIFSRCWHDFWSQSPWYRCGAETSWHCSAAACAYQVPLGDEIPHQTSHLRLVQRIFHFPIHFVCDTKGLGLHSFSLVKTWLSSCVSPAQTWADLCCRNQNLPWYDDVGVWCWSKVWHIGFVVDFGPWWSKSHSMLWLVSNCFFFLFLPFVVISFDDDESWSQSKPPKFGLTSGCFPYCCCNCCQSGCCFRQGWRYSGVGGVGEPVRTNPRR